MATFNGTATDDILPLAGADNSGDDVFYGWGGNDVLYGGMGSDTLYGEMGDDLLVGGAGVDDLFGGFGSDTVSYADEGGFVNVDLAIGEARITYDIRLGTQLADRLSEVENVIGTARQDYLFGNDVANRLSGGGDDDRIGGRGGNDVLDGGDGNDVLDGGAGADLLQAGVGNDILFGSDGDDTLQGMAGNDELGRGAGKDTMLGGSGADRFVFQSVGEATPSAGLRDVIADFSHADGDKIDLSGIDANVNLAGDQAFEWSGVTPFYGVAGQLHFTKGALEGDIDGDRVADFSIQMPNATVPLSVDLIL